MRKTRRRTKEKNKKYTRKRKKCKEKTNKQTKRNQSKKSAGYPSRTIGLFFFSGFNRYFRVEVLSMHLPKIRSPFRLSQSCTWMGTIGEVQRISFVLIVLIAYIFLTYHQIPALVTGHTTVDSVTT